MLKMANAATPQQQTMKKTNNEEDTEESEIDMDEEEEEEEDDEEDDLPDDVGLQIDSEDEAELEAQRIRLDEAAKTAKTATKAEKLEKEEAADAEAAAAVAAPAAAAAVAKVVVTTKSQVSNGKDKEKAKPKPAENKAKKPRGRPTGTSKSRANGRRASISSLASSSSLASQDSAASAAALVAAQVLADEKSHQFIYSCSDCSHHYADSLILAKHFQKMHAKPKSKRKRAKTKASTPEDEDTPPLNQSLLDMNSLKPCAQLLMQGESLLQLCLACNSQFVESKHFREHLSQQHGYFKLLVPKEEPTELPPLAMVTIPSELAEPKSSGQQFQLPIPAPETPPPEQDVKETTAPAIESNDKEDLDMISAMVAEIAAERVKKTCSPKVSKMIIKLPTVNKRARKRSKPDKKREKKASSVEESPAMQEDLAAEEMSPAGKKLHQEKVEVPLLEQPLPATEKESEDKQNEADKDQSNKDVAAPQFPEVTEEVKSKSSNFVKEKTSQEKVVKEPKLRKSEKAQKQSQKTKKDQKQTERSTKLKQAESPKEPNNEPQVSFFWSSQAVEIF